MGRGGKEISQRVPLVPAKKKHNTWDFSFFPKALSFPVFMIFEGLKNENVTFKIFQRMPLISTNFFEKAGDYNFCVQTLILKISFNLF